MINSKINEELNKMIAEKYLDFKNAINVKNIDDFENQQQLLYYKLLNHDKFDNITYKLINNNDDENNFLLEFKNNNNEKINIFIYKDLIENANTNIIVDTLNNTLSLGGGIAGAISNKGGVTIQNELNEIKKYMTDYFENDKYKGLCVTNSGNINKVNKIYHIVGPNNFIINNDEKFQKKIYEITLFTLEIFNKFNNNNTITFPTISSGIFLGNTNIETALKPFIKAFFTYYNFNYQNYKLFNNTIYIVIFNKDTRDEYNKLKNIINNNNVTQIYNYKSTTLSNLISSSNPKQQI